VVSSVGFSLNGLIVRSLEDATPWQILFWRGLGVFLGQGMILIWIHRSRVASQFLRIGRWGVVASVLNGCSPIGFFFALTHTTVANVVFLMSAMPFVSAIMAPVVLGERIHATTLRAIPIAFVGIVVMVGDSILTGTWLGNLFAALTVLNFSMFVVILRYSRGRNMQPVLVIGGLVSIVFAGVVTGGEVMLSMHDVALCFALGFVITGFGHLMFMKAAQILPAGEVTFLC
jgi:drug/metabolite transporter (DMT)-like permease